MAISDILASIDRDIAQLQQARALLSGAEKKGRQTKESGSSDCPQEGGSCRKARQEKETESLTRRAEADRGSGQAPLGEATQGR